MAEELTQLADRLEALEASEEAVDRAIEWAVYRDRPVTPGAYTDSLEEAMTLIPDGWDMGLARKTTGLACAEMSNAKHVFMVETKWCHNPAIAVTVAALRARAEIQRLRKEGE